MINLNALLWIDDRDVGTLRGRWSSAGLNTQRKRSKKDTTTESGKKRSLGRVSAARAMEIVTGLALGHLSLTHAMLKEAALKCLGLGNARTETKEVRTEELRLI